MNIIELTKRAVELASKDEKLKERTKDTVVSIVMVLKNEEEHSFAFAVNKGKLEFLEKTRADPDFQFEMSEKDYSDLMTGKAYGMVLMATGKMRMTKGSWAQIRKIVTPLGMIPKAGEEIAAKEESKTAKPPAANKGKLNVLAKVRPKLKQRVKERTPDLEVANIYSQSFLDSIADGLIATDLEGNITAVNKAILKMNKRTKEEVIGKFAPEVFLKPQDIEKFMKYFPEVIEKGHVGSFEGTGIAKDGTEVPTTTTVSLLKDRKGKPHSFLCVLRDTTKTNKLINELEKSKTLLDSVLNSTIDSIAIVNLDGAVTRISKVSLERSGYSKEEMIGNIPTFLVSEKDRAKFPDLIGEVIEKGFVKNVEMTEITKDGREIPIMFNATLMRDVEGEPTGIVAVARDMTELRRAEEQRTAVIEAMPDALVVLDLNGVILSVNPAFTKMLGRKPEERIGKSFDELGDSIKPKDIEKFMKLLGELIEEGHVEPLETVLGTKDGRKLPVSITYSLVKDAKGKPLNIVASLRDITELKRAEEERAEAAAIRERAAIVDAMGDGLIVVDLEGNITLVNKAFVKQSGYKEEELIGTPVVNMPTIRPGDIEKVMELMKEVIEKGSAGPIGMPGVRRDAKEVYFSFTASVLKDPKGKPIAFFGVVRDITERKRAEEMLFKEHNLLQALINNVPDSIYFKNDKNRFIRVNKIKAQHSGTTPEEMIGKTDFDFFPEQEAKRCFADDNRVMKSNRPLLDRVEKITHVDGTERWFSTTKIPWHNERGGVIGTTGISRDITERKKSEEALIQSERLRALGEMAGGVAHDFNNLLTIILGNAQLLERGIRRYEVEEIKERLRVIARTASEGGETTRRLQQFTRREVSIENFARIDLNEIVREAIASTSPRWKDKAEAEGTTIRIKQKLGKLPPLLGNRSELMEVLTNLIFNSLEAMPKGGEITIKTEAKENEAFFYFTDTGQGIPNSIKDKIFDPFFTTKDLKASGLGLSTSYGIVTRHHGKIKVESIEGKGTTFTISIPIPLKVSSKKKKLEEPEKISSRNILIIDDEEGVRDILGRIFQDEGHRVTLAQAGKEGLEEFKKGDFDLVLTDLGMPKMSGWELAKRIKEIDPSVPVGLVTGWAVALTRNKTKEKGVDFILSKPFDYAKVVREVNAVLKSKSR